MRNALPVAKRATRLPIQKTYKLFVGGKFSRSESGRVAPVTSGGDIVANYARASRKDFRDAVGAARGAIAGWSKQSAYLRGQILYRAAEMLERDAGAIARELAGLEAGLDDVDDTARVLTTVAESFRNYEVVAKREAELRDELSRLPEVVATVPTFDTDVTDVAGLARIGEYLFEVGDGPWGAAGTLTR